MKWRSKDKRTMINLNKVDAYEYTVVDGVKINPKFKSFQVYLNFLKLYVNGAVIEVNGEDADDIYKILTK